MLELLQKIHYSTTLNMSISEGIVLTVLALVSWKVQKKVSILPSIYTVFLILYITLLRRAPGYDETIRLNLRLLPNAATMAGNLLNLILYFPFGWTLAYWMQRRENEECFSRDSWLIILSGMVLSVFCEGMQYITGRGCADVNDVVFNSLGVIVGIWVVRKIKK